MESNANVINQIISNYQCLLKIIFIFSWRALEMIQVYNSLQINCIDKENSKTGVRCTYSFRKQPH